MNKIERLNLKKMIKTNDVQDFTNEIRDKKHSDIIKKDVLVLMQLKKEYDYLDYNKFDEIAVLKCNFIFTHYTEIYNKVKKDEINIDTLFEFLKILKRIEDKEIDQHEGSFEVGKILKKMYIDSAIITSDKLDKKNEEMMTKTKPIVKNISWRQYKKL